MQRSIFSWYSERLNKEMPLVVYGSYGVPVLLFPTASQDYLEAERFNLIDSLSELIDSGKIKVYSIDSINNESWGNMYMHPHDKAVRNLQYNEYVRREVVPFIYNDCDGEQPIISTGASMGAFYAANMLFKYPEVITGVVGMHGVYTIEDYCGDYFDMDCYMCSPMNYLANLDDDYYLPKLREKKHIHILSSTGMWEHTEFSTNLSDVLKSKDIPHNLDIWGDDIPHDWPSWQKMLPHYLYHIIYDL